MSYRALSTCQFCGKGRIRFQYPTPAARILVSAPAYLTLRASSNQTLMLLPGGAEIVEMRGLGHLVVLNGRAMAGGDVHRLHVADGRARVSPRTKGPAASRSRSRRNPIYILPGSMTVTA